MRSRVPYAGILRNFDDMNLELEKCQSIVNSELNKLFNESAKYKTLLEAIRYSLLSDGKRIRAAICLKFCEASCGSIEHALKSACAIEMIHTYSLIHDDLPCMDNDDMRRGKPSNHIKYDVFTATLAGDALQAAAFETLLQSNLRPAIVVELGRVLAKAAGPHGICGGQYLDVRGEGKSQTKEDISTIHKLKTTALISASAKMGVLAAGGKEKQLRAAADYAEALGLAFQVRDDLLDVISTEEEFGKPVGSDKSNDKQTFATLFGVEECKRIIKTETQKAIDAVCGGVFDDARFLVWLARMLEERKS